MFVMLRGTAAHVDQHNLRCYTVREMDLNQQYQFWLDNQHTNTNHYKAK
jgi:hypothetical protein